jgi:hypothetical protein
LAGLGFFAQELNIGWEEWSEAKLPTHAERVARGQIRCSCSDEIELGRAQHP